MSRIPLYALSLAFVLLPVLASPAAGQAAGSPEQVAAEYSQKFVERDYLGASLLMHPTALAEIRELVEVISEVDPASVSAMFGMTSEELEAASSEAVVAGFFGGIFELEPGLGELMSSARHDFIGHVMEGDTVHVVTRTHMRLDAMTEVTQQMGDGVALEEMSQMGVTSLLPHEGELKVLLTGEIRGVVQMLRSMMTGM